MNIYDRIINILLEARIEDYLDRLDEKSHMGKKLIGKQGKLDKNKNGKLDSDDFKKLRADESKLEERNKENRAKVKAFQASKDRTPHVAKSPTEKLAAGRRNLDRGPGQRTPAQVATDAQIARKINKGKK